jgi:hypothetical protein
LRLLTDGLKQLEPKITKALEKRFPEPDLDRGLCPACDKSWEAHGLDDDTLDDDTLYERRIGVYVGCLPFPGKKSLGKLFKKRK